MHAEAENGAAADKSELAKQLNPDTIHDTVYEMTRVEACHGKAFAVLLGRCLGK